LNAISDAHTAGKGLECCIDEVSIGAGVPFGPPAAPPPALRGADDSARPDCPCAWGSSNAPTDFRLAGNPTPCNGRTPATRATGALGKEAGATELQVTPLSPKKLALQAGPSANIHLSRSPIDFEHVYRMYRKRVYTKCLNMIRNEAEAEDLTQEVFLQVFRKMDSFRGESAFATWLYRVAVNLVLARLRRKSLDTSSLEEVSGREEGMPRLHLVLGAPDTRLATALDRLNLERAFSQMPTGYRQVLLMHDLEGYEHHEIAGILNLSAGTSKSQLHKARVWLREALHAGEAQQMRRGVGGRTRRDSQAAGGRRRCFGQPVLLDHAPDQAGWYEAA